MFLTRLTLAALAAALAAPALAQDVQYELVNRSGLTLMEFYTSAVDEGAWGDDLLGANVLASEESGTVALSDAGAQCAYDLRFVFEDGSELVDTVDVCDAGRYTLTAN
jgi:hypothetical protein